MAPRHDTGSGSGGFPAAPALGAQIDRLGRPAINTVLNHGFDGSASSAGAAKDAYNADGSPGGWLQYVPRVREEPRDRRRARHGAEVCER